MKEITKKEWLIAIGVGLAVVLMIEIIVVAILWSNSDEVYCNWLWCEFKQQRTTIESRITRSCFKDNIEVNCSENDFDYMAEDGVVNCDKYSCQPIIDYIKMQQNLSD